MSLSLPDPRSRPEYEALDLRTPAFLNAAAEACKKEIGPLKTIEAFKTGSSPVFDIDGRSVLKMYAPINHSQFETERDALGFLAKLDFPYSPRILAAGVIAGWDYLLMQKLPGMSLAEAWPKLSGGQKQGLVHKVGGLCKQLHALPVDGLDLGGSKWQIFMEAQKKGCRDRQKGFGLPEDFLEQIPAFLESVELKRSAQPVFLHTELMRDHVFVAEKDGIWDISGLIDLEPAALGDPEYDFPAVGLFVSGTETDLFSAFLKGYGADISDPGLSKRVMAYMLLHRYSNLNWYLGFMPKARSLEALAGSWFPMAG